MNVNALITFATLEKLLAFMVSRPAAMLYYWDQGSLNDDVSSGTSSQHLSHLVCTAALQQVIVNSDRRCYQCLPFRLAVSIDLCY